MHLAPRRFSVAVSPPRDRDRRFVSRAAATRQRKVAADSGAVTADLPELQALPPQRILRASEGLTDHAVASNSRGDVAAALLTSPHWFRRPDSLYVLDGNGPRLGRAQRVRNASASGSIRPAVVKAGDGDTHVAWLTDNGRVRAGFPRRASGESDNGSQVRRPVAL